MIAPPASRAEYVRRIRDQHLAPLWDVLGGLVTAEPKTVIAPYRWRYREIRPTLLESAGVITAKELARRVEDHQQPLRRLPVDHAR
jgi:gentisate 1,2-dioxygenase